MDALPHPELDENTRLRLLIDSLVDYAVYMLDPSGHIASWNVGARRFKGYEADEVLGQHFSRFFTEEGRAAGEPQAALATALREGKFETENWRVRKDGTRFWASVVIDPIIGEDGRHLGFVKITRDITEKREAQEALAAAQASLFQSQKMEAVGQLTGGVAHDFNNLLTVIINNLAMLSRTATSEREARLIDSAQKAAGRGAKLTQQLLAFSRRQQLRPDIHDPTALILSFEEVLRNACGETVDVVLDLAPSTRSARIDAAQFETALLNLLLNARDAMPEGGPIRVVTQEVTLDAAQGQRLNLPAGAYVSVTVEDRGHGMSAETIRRSVEPFFTTKEVGKGTGLGLSQVYGFVAQSGGNIDIESGLGEGTRIRILLPAVDALPETLADGAPVAPEQADAAGRVLIVEDEEDVREVAVELFASLGYDVLTAADGVAAMDILRQPGDIDVVFSDVVMPKGITGFQLAHKARELRPGIKVLLASGYPVSALAQQASSPEAELQETSFISKPYQSAELADKLRGLRAC